MADLTDDEILQACRRDPQRGFTQLMKQYAPAVYGCVRRMVVGHEDAEDIVQETFLRVFASFDSFKRNSRLQTWIYRIATNEALRFLERKRSETLSDEAAQAHLLNQLQASSYVDFDNEMAVRFQEAILRLPPKQRLVFNLRYYDELDYQSISDITGDAVATLKVNYHWAKEKIKDYLTK